MLRVCNRRDGKRDKLLQELVELDANVVRKKTAAHNIGRGAFADMESYGNRHVGMACSRF